jgi:CheY-like chemotaxis protein
MIQQAATRAAALTDQMLAYAGGSGLQLQPLDVSETIREMLLLLESTASRRTSLHCELAEALPPVRADRAQLSQVIMNLVSNASEALGSDGGSIQLRSGVVDADRELLKGCVVGEVRDPGRYVYIEVCDDGPGIDPESRARIFDPFFTTKSTGRGLGLSVVLGIVREHGGALQIESTPGVETCFRVLLPAVAEVESEPRPEPRTFPTRYAPSPLTGYFLVVDDDEAIREFTSILLERAGFSTRTAATGREAIDIVQKREHERLGVILDLTMPGLSGARVCEEILKIDPATRILLISGYTRERVEEALLENGKVEFLQKPFDSDQLLEAIRRLLDARD